MPFSVVHTNNVVEVRQRPLGDRDAAEVASRVKPAAAQSGGVRHDKTETSSVHGPLPNNKIDRPAKRARIAASEAEPARRMPSVLPGLKAAVLTAVAGHDPSRITFAELKKNIAAALCVHMHVIEEHKEVIRAILSEHIAAVRLSAEDSGDVSDAETFAASQMPGSTACLSKPRLPPRQ